MEGVGTAMGMPIPLLPLFSLLLLPPLLPLGEQQRQDVTTLQPAQTGLHKSLPASGFVFFVFFKFFSIGAAS